MTWYNECKSIKNPSGVGSTLGHGTERGVSMQLEFTIFPAPPHWHSPLLPERFWNKVTIAPNGCWLWIAYKGNNGYGQFGWGGGSHIVLVHRLSYAILVGPIPDGLQVDHLCHQRACVNPLHLEPVTRLENLRRGDNPRSLKTHCPQGHIYDSTNTIWSLRCRVNRQDTWGRHCYQCALRHNRDYKRRRRLVDAHYGRQKQT